MTRAAGEAVFFKAIAHNPLYLAAAYDNVLLGCLYEALYHEPFAPDASGRPLGGSLTPADLRDALEHVRDATQLASLRDRFQQSQRNLLRMAAREALELTIPSVLPPGLE